MPQIEKGAPRKGRGPNNSRYGDDVRKLAERAFADKGEWYSIPWPTDVKRTTIFSVARQAIAIVAGTLSTKDGRIWIRFYKDFDASE